MNRESGYTYISILLVVFALALTAQSTWIPASTTARREAETELLFRGLAYRAAIESYYLRDAERPQFPPNLAALISDPRYDGVRHLRVLYDNPLAKADWAIIPAPVGGIAGVAPRSDTRPLKQAGFSKSIKEFAESDSYAQWKFVFNPTKN